ncbi:MAG: PLP-dependent transferase [Lentisphaeraceae bacterium]|nr:PLP-dependent transferase [Lentisphaeraceae bacterium]
MKAVDKNNIEAAKILSPKRKSTTAKSIEQLALEQLEHFNIDKKSAQGKALKGLIKNIYSCQTDLKTLWDTSLACLEGLDKKDKISFFNAKRFICFQLAKLLDGLQNPMRKSYQGIVAENSTKTAKGPYPIFDNVTAIFSATPVITRTATYLYACTEWIDDAFQGKELLHEIYSRLMNPTSVSLANHIVDLEAGSRADEYFAWNFNSGMAAIDGILSHLLGYQDIVIASRNVYGGTHQLLHDWFGKKSNLDISLEFFDGYTEGEYRKFLKKVKKKYGKQLKAGKHIYTFIESPCNPHGYVLDVEGICQSSHEEEIDVICDCTVGTPFLTSTLKVDDPMKRPDFVVHSYTKDILGSGTTTAGVVIGRNERMFIAKGDSVTCARYDGKKVKYSWENTLFWNVYYIKGAFLDADKAFEVLNGMRTMELRVLRKCISTIVFAKALDSHPLINVKCNALVDNENHSLVDKNYLSLPAPLFTVDMEAALKKGLKMSTFKKFFDSLEPVFGLQVSLGQMNSVVLCPALTSHSELSEKALKEAGISKTTIRISIGDEDPRALIAHIIRVAQLTIDEDIKKFSLSFLTAEEIDLLYKTVYLDVHQRHLNELPSLADSMSF